MFPFLPSATINDLALEHFAHHERTTGRTPPLGSGEAFAEDALRPDPIFMGLRTLVQGGPIGALVQWLNRGIESREERRETVATPDTIAEDRAVHFVERPGHDQPDERIAA